MRPEHEWVVERREAFACRGPSGNPAITDLVIVTRDGSVPVVVATEREDSWGISVTNGAEQLAAEVLIRLFPERASEPQPFRLVEHYRDGAFDGTMQEVHFADFAIRHDSRVPRIGDVKEWKHLDARVAAVLAEQTKDRPRHREREHNQQAIEAPKQSRGMRR